MIFLLDSQRDAGGRGILEVESTPPITMIYIMESQRTVQGSAILGVESAPLSTYLLDVLRLAAVNRDLRILTIIKENRISSV